MFTGGENRRNVNMENLMVQIFERKKRIVEQVKQQVDLFDQHLASKCLLAGVSPPPWLWSPSLPSQTSELSKEEIISGLLFPQSRLSIICPSSRPFSYQQPVSFLADNVARQDLKEQLLEEEQQHDLSHNLVRRVSNHYHEQDANRDVHEKEGLPESVSTDCRENQSCLSPEYIQNQRVENSLDASTSPGRSQGKMVPKSVSTTGCEQKPSSPGYCQDEAEPNTCVDPGLPVAKIQRSKSRQKAMELRSSAKASKSRSNCRNEPKPSPGGNIGLEIASLRSNSVSEINLFKHDENDEGCLDEEEKCNSQGEGRDQCIKFSSATESSTPLQKVDSEQPNFTGETCDSIVQESLLEPGHVNEINILQTTETTPEVSARVEEQVDDPSSPYASIVQESLLEFGHVDEINILQTTETTAEVSARVEEQVHDPFSPYTSIVPESLLESGHVNEMNILQNFGTIDEVSAKVDEQVDDPQSRSCNETTYLNGGTSSKSSSQESSKREHQMSSKSVSGDFPLRKSNPSHRAGHEVELPQVISLTNEVSMVTDAGTSIFQSEVNARSGSNARGDRSKTEHSGSGESSPVDVEPRHSISVLQGADVKESPVPSTINVEGLVGENITSDDQSKEKGECADTNRRSSAGRVSHTGISTDEMTFASGNQDPISKTELLGFVESSSVELQLRHSVLQSDDESVLLKPANVTGEALLMEKDNNGELIEISSCSESGSLSQTDIMGVEPVVVESILQESGTPENSIDHSKRCDISCRSKEVLLQRSLTKAGSSQCHGRISTPGSSAIEEKSANGYKALSVGFDHQSADKDFDGTAENLSLRTHDLPVFLKPESPHFDDYDESNFGEIPMHSREESTMEKVPTPASAVRVLDVASFTDSEVNLWADNEMNDMEDHDCLKKETVPETESPASHTGLKVGDNEPPELNTFTGHTDALTKRPQSETSSDKGVPPINRNIACTETGESHGVESSIQKIFCSSSSMGGSQLQNKRRKTLGKLISRMPSSSPGGDVLDSGSVRETVHHREEAACHNLDHYDAELQKIIGSASSDHYDVELQKMIGSASSDHYNVELQKMIGSTSPAELRLEEGYIFKEAGLMIPDSLSFRPEQLSVQRSHIAPNQESKSEYMDFFPVSGETSHPFTSCVVRDSNCSPCLSPFGLIGSNDGSPASMEGFIIQTDDENQSSSKNQIKPGSFQLPRTTTESATMIEQIRKSACRTTPSRHLAKTFKFNVSTELLDGMFCSQNLECSSAFDNLGIDNDYTGRSYTESLPFSGVGSSANARNPRTSPTEKLWYRSLERSSSSEKRGSQTPDLPCISEENENVDEEAENLCINTPNSMSIEKRGSSVPDLPCIAEENENIDDISEAVNEASDSERENVSAERKPLGDINEDPMKFLPSVSEAKIPVDRQSLDSVNTAFSFSATCNNSVKSKLGRQNGRSRRLTGKGKENQSGTGAGRNVKPPSSRFSKAKLSCNSSLTTLGPRLPEKEPKYNNIVSNMTSFVPLVQKQKPVAALITGKRDVKVKALEAAEASKRIAEQKENDRKMKKEAMKLERAKQEQENLRKQEMEKKKKEEDRKKKEAEIAWKQEMEKKKKEEERKRKEFEMADRKRQREEDKKLKEAKRQRVAEMQRQQKEADQKLQAEKELRKQDARIKAQKELKEDQSNAEKTRGQANTRIPGVRSKSNSSDDTNSSRTSRDDDFMVISNPGKLSEESYDVSPYKCSDDEDDEEDDYDNLHNHKFVPTWASKSNILLPVISQHNLDSDIIFPLKTFSNLSQVLLPRRLRLQ